MTSGNDLTLYEQLVLLALVPTSIQEPLRMEKKYLDIGVSGAILILLLRSGRVTFQRGGFEVRGQLSVGGKEVDELLKGLENKADPFRPLRLGKWLRRAARARPQNAVISGLVIKGVLARKKSNLFILQPEMREEIVKRLSEAIRDKQRADEKTAALAGLAHATKCLKRSEFGEELKRCTAQLNALGRQSGPVIPAVRTAVAQRKLVTSIASAVGSAAGAGVTVALLRACSS